MNKIIIGKETDVPLSKEQKMFNRLNEQIIKQKELLQNWQNNISEFKNIYASEMYVLQVQYNDLKKQMIYFIDEVYDDKTFTKTERNKMLYFIEDIGLEFANSDQRAKEIYNNRCNSDFDMEQETLNKMRVNDLKSNIARDFDIDLDHINADNMGDFMREFTKHMEESMEEYMEDEDNEWNAQQKAKAFKKEAKIAKENKEVSQSIKEVYRQLIKNVHPDRETNLNEQHRKTELMQKINTAYNKNDLLTLLQLQLDIEQISPVRVDKIKNYNIILKNQLKEIKEEISLLCEQFDMEYNLPIVINTASPNKIIAQLKYDVADLRCAVEELKESISSWKNHANFKAQLKSFRIPNGR